MDKEKVEKDFAEFKNILKTAKGADKAKGAIKTLTGKVICALVALLLLIIIVNANGGGGKKTGGSAKSSGKLKTIKAEESDFNVLLTKDGAGVVICAYTKDYTYEHEDIHLIIPDKIQGLPVVEIGVGYNHLEEYNGSRGVFNMLSTVDKKYLIKNITLPKTLELIGAQAFLGDMIESIEFPKTLKKVEYEAFSGTKLKKVVMRSDIEWENGVFDGCNNLEEIIIEEGITKIPDNMFKETAVKSIEIPASTKTIGHIAFAGCMNLTDVKFKSPNTKIGRESFPNCDKLSLETQAEIRKRYE